MGITARMLTDEVTYALVYALNALRKVQATAAFHYDATSRTSNANSPNPTVTPLTVSSPNASSLPTSLALCNELTGIAWQHAPDKLAHKVPDLSALPGRGGAVDLPTAITIANLLKAWHNAHIPNTTFHANADAVNAIAAPNATDQTTVNTLLNELKVDMIIHIQNAMAGSSVALVPA